MIDETTPFTVLAVDDQKAILDGLALIIEIAAGSSILASSGKEALRIVATDYDNIDLVILDMGMPDLSGEQVANKIREIDPTMPIIISSGYDEFQLMAQLNLSKGVSFVRKPYLIETMMQAIKENIKSGNGDKLGPHF